MSFIEEQIKKYELQLELLNLGMLAKAAQLKDLHYDESIEVMKSTTDIIRDIQDILEYYKKRLKEETEKSDNGEE